MRERETQAAPTWFATAMIIGLGLFTAILRGNDDRQHTSAGLLVGLLQHIFACSTAGPVAGTIACAARSLSECFAQMLVGFVCERVHKGR